MFAATDTTSGAMSRTLSKLADHKDIQTLLRTEIRGARTENHEHDLEYDDLLALPLLDAVVKETLRLCVSYLPA
jgi:cytochrome P450